MHKKVPKVRQGSRAGAIPAAPSLNNSSPQSATNDATVKEPKRTLEVDFLELEDGTLLEMIEDPHDATKSLLVSWKNGKVQYLEKLRCGNQVFVPLPRNTAIIRHLRLADGIESLESARDLFKAIMCFLAHTLELSPAQLFLLSSYVLSIWLIEKLPSAPYVAFVGPPGSGKTTALRILSLLCRRSLLTSDISSSAFHEVCDKMTPTVLIDETATVDNRRQLFHVLRAGTSKDFVAVRKNSTFKLYGARAVSWTELPNDAALNSRCLLISMTSCKRTDLASPNDPQLLRVAKMLQRKLLQFRLTNYQTLTLPKIAGEEHLEPRARDLFRALALPFGKEKEICEALLLLVKEQESLRELLSVYQTAVLDSLYDIIHTYPESNHFKLSALTEHVNANLRRRGESGNLSEKRVGDLLTSLHLTDRKRTNTGYILWLDRKTREEIHSMAHKHGINDGPGPELSEQCELCQASSQHPASGSTTKPIRESAGAEANDRGELGEHGEHRKRGGRRKPAQAGLARPRITRLQKPPSPKPRRYLIRPRAPKNLL